MHPSENDIRGFIESAEIPPTLEVYDEEGVELVPLKLDQLPDGVVTGNTLIDLSKTHSVALRSGVSLAVLFASRVADKALGAKADEARWFAAYTGALRKLGFTVSDSAATHSRFESQGMLVHKAIVPFLTIAMGGVGVGPVIMAALENLRDADAAKPWITLFDRESRRFSSREISFAAVQEEPTGTVIRHVAARLNVDSQQVSVLFFRVTTMAASFNSVTTSMRADNTILAAIEPQLRARLSADVGSFIADATI
jgi:hypothetical protein